MVYSVVETLPNSVWKVDNSQRHLRKAQGMIEIRVVLEDLQRARDPLGQLGKSHFSNRWRSTDVSGYKLWHATLKYNFKGFGRSKS